MKYFFTHFLIFLFLVKFIFAQQATLVEVDRIKLDTKSRNTNNRKFKVKKITNIMAPVAGKLIMYIEEGDIVKKGQLL